MANVIPNIPCPPQIGLAGNFPTKVSAETFRKLSGNLKFKFPMEIYEFQILNFRWKSMKIMKSTFPKRWEQGNLSVDGDLAGVHFSFPPCSPATLASFQHLSTNDRAGYDPFAMSPCA